MLRGILDKLELRGKEFLADRLYDVRWLRGYLGRKGIKGVIRVRRDRVGREDVEWGEYKERDEIEGLFGDLKMKLSGYVAAYREDMAMVMALVKFLFCNMYVIYFCLIFLTLISYFCHSCPDFWNNAVYGVPVEIGFIRIPECDECSFSNFCSIYWGSRKSEIVSVWQSPAHVISQIAFRTSGSFIDEHNDVFPLVHTLWIPSNLCIIVMMSPL